MAVLVDNQSQSRQTKEETNHNEQSSVLSKMHAGYHFTDDCRFTGYSSRMHGLSDPSEEGCASRRGSLRTEISANPDSRESTTKTQSQGGLDSRTLALGRQKIRLGKRTLGSESSWGLDFGSLGKASGRLGLGHGQMAVVQYS